MPRHKVPTLRPDPSAARRLTRCGSRGTTPFQTRPGAEPDEHATLRGRTWYNVLDTQVVTLDVPQLLTRSGSRGGWFLTLVRIPALDWFLDPKSKGFPDTNPTGSSDPNLTRFPGSNPKIVGARHRGGGEPGCNIARPPLWLFCLRVLKYTR